jgi:hypothetical protein
VVPVCVVVDLDYLETLLDTLKKLLQFGQIHTFAVAQVRHVMLTIYVIRDVALLLI